MQSVTIDKLDIAIHERYARDQADLDPTFINESNLIARYSEIAGTSTIFPSQFDLLFELHTRNLSWALFSPPLMYRLQPNRFFSYQLLPTITVGDMFDKEDEDSQEEEEEQQKREDKRHQLIQSIVQAKKGRRQSVSQFESEKSSLLSLLESIRDLDKILCLINSKKHQYQKG